MSETKNIGKHVAAICKELGLDPPFTKQMTITPNSVEAVVYLKDENGNKHTIPAAEYLPSSDPDSEVSGFTTTVATETLNFEVRT